MRLIKTIDNAYEGDWMAFAGDLFGAFMMIAFPVLFCMMIALFGGKL